MTNTNPTITQTTIYKTLHRKLKIVLTNTNPTITQTTIYKTLHRKLKIDQHEPNYHSNNHLQNTTQKTKDWPTQTQLSLKQPSTKHYTENKTLTNTNPTITQTTIYKTLHRKLKIDQHKPNYHSNNHLQNTTQKTKDWPTRTQLSLKQPSTKRFVIHRKLKIWPTRTQLSLKQPIYKTLHRKLKIDKHKPNYNSNNHLQNTTQKTKELTNKNPTITQTTIYKTLHRKLKIDQHKPNYHLNNHLQNITQKTKHWPTQTQLSLKQPSTKHYTEN